MKVPYVSSLKKWKNLIGSGKVIVCDFTAVWCAPCKRIAPSYQKLADKYKNNPKVVFVKIDVDDNPETSERCQIIRMPTFQIWKDKTKIGEFTGAKTEIMENIEKVIKKY